MGASRPGLAAWHAQWCRDRRGSGGPCVCSGVRVRGIEGGGVGGRHLAHRDTCTHPLCTCAHTHTHARRWAESVAGSGPPSPCSPLSWGQLRRETPPPPCSPISLPKHEAPRKLGLGGSGDLDVWGPRNVPGFLLALLRFVLFSGKQMEKKKAPFPHFWRLICINRPKPITLRVNGGALPSLAPGPGLRAGGDGASGPAGAAPPPQTPFMRTPCQPPAGVLLGNLQGPVPSFAWPCVVPAPSPSRAWLSGSETPPSCVP